MRAALFVALVAACTPSHVVALTAAQPIHNVDWRNRTYRFEFDDKTTDYTIGNGVLMHSQYGDPDYLALAIDVPQYGDVTGDHVDEALIHLIREQHDPRRVDELQVFTLRDGQPILLGTIVGGILGYRGVYDISVVAGDITLSRNMSANAEIGEGHPTMWQTEKWHWNGAQFVEDEVARKCMQRFADGSTTCRLSALGVACH